MGYQETIKKLCDAGLNPGKTIAQTKKETGKELVGCFPIHTPEEIVYAAGCISAKLLLLHHENQY